MMPSHQQSTIHDIMHCIPGVLLQQYPLGIHSFGNKVVPHNRGFCPFGDYGSSG